MTVKLQRFVNSSSNNSLHWWAGVCHVDMALVSYMTPSEYAIMHCLIESWTNLELSLIWLISTVQISNLCTGYLTGYFCPCTLCSIISLNWIRPRHCTILGSIKSFLFLLILDTRAYKRPFVSKLLFQKGLPCEYQISKKVCCDKRINIKHYLSQDPDHE